MSNEPLKVTDVGAWVTEFIKRFGLKSPKFFQVWQTIGVVAIGVGFIPDTLEYLNITLNPHWANMLAIVLKAAGGALWLMAKLPVNNVSTVIAATDSLPFTEKKKAQGVDIPPTQTVEEINNKL